MAKNDYNKKNKKLFSQKGFVSLLPADAAEKSFTALWDWEEWWKHIAYKYNVPFIDKCEDCDTGDVVRRNSTSGELEYFNGSAWVEQTPVATPLVAQNDIAAGTGGAIPVTNYLTTINTDAGGDAFTLADGTTIGQQKKIKLVVDGGGDAVITPANLNSGTTITMNDAGDFVLLQWGGTEWYVLENSGTTIA